MIGRTPLRVYDRQIGWRFRLEAPVEAYNGRTGTIVAFERVTSAVVGFVPEVVFRVRLDGDKDDCLIGTGWMQPN